MGFFKKYKQDVSAFDLAGRELYARLILAIPSAVNDIPHIVRCEIIQCLREKLDAVANEPHGLMNVRRALIMLLACEGEDEDALQISYGNEELLFESMDPSSQDFIKLIECNAVYLRNLSANKFATIVSRCFQAGAAHACKKLREIVKDIIELALVLDSTTRDPEPYSMDEYSKAFEQKKRYFEAMSGYDFARFAFYWADFFNLYYDREWQTALKRIQPQIEGMIRCASDSEQLPGLRWLRGMLILTSPDFHRWQEGIEEVVKADMRECQTAKLLLCDMPPVGLVSSEQICDELKIRSDSISRIMEAFVKKMCSDQLDDQDVDYMTSNLFLRDKFEWIIYMIVASQGHDDQERKIADTLRTSYRDFESKSGVYFRLKQREECPSSPVYPSDFPQKYLWYQDLRIQWFIEKYDLENAILYPNE